MLGILHTRWPDSIRQIGHQATGRSGAKLPADRPRERMTVEALADTRVMVVNGARQVGKSTLAELIVARSPGAREFYLADLAVRAAAKADPSAFVWHGGLLMIDEIQGGYPEAVRRDPGRRRARFFDSYVTDLVTRDVQQISDIERPAEMRRLLSVVAARMGTLAVAQSMANDIALPRRTLSRYLDLLELIFVIKRIPAWSSNLTTRAISTPKLIVTDSGLGGRLIGMSEERAKDPLAPVGPLLENFAIGEVARQLTWAEEPVQLFHYRDRDQVEVDMVLEHAAGSVVGIEVKAAETVRAEDFRGLRHLANRLGGRFLAGIVLYAGEQQLSFGDRLTALPMAALWTLDSSAP
jgi:predicted AAA+ superfamily ATPase